MRRSLPLLIAPLMLAALAPTSVAHAQANANTNANAQAQANASVDAGTGAEAVAEAGPTVEPEMNTTSPASVEGVDGDSVSNMDLGELDRKLNNPLTDIWSLTFQNNTGWLDGDDLEETENTNLLFFQPFLPFEVGSEKQAMLTLRPVFPLVTQPVFEDPNSAASTGHETGFGDLQLLALAGPNDAEGLIWGAGITTKFPTASEDVLGQGKYQAGPAAMLFYMGNPWVAGILAQHWTDVGGDSDRADVKETNIQYILRRSIPNAMSIGLGPTIVIDWEAESGQRLTFPIGLGVTKTTRWGKTPVKLRAELHYSVERPDAVGTEWNFRLQITPIIDNPFKD